MSLAQVAALIAAIAFLLLCGALAVPLFRLRHTVDAATQTINDLNDRTGPILGNVNTTLENVNTALTQAQTTLDGVNIQLARIDTITEHVSHVTANVANLTTVVTSAAASPLGKAAAFERGESLDDDLLAGDFYDDGDDFYGRANGARQRIGDDR